MDWAADSSALAEAVSEFRPNLSLFTDWMGHMLLKRSQEHSCLAFYLRSGDIFNVMGVTITATFNDVNPGGPPEHFKSADMVFQLFLAIIGVLCTHTHTTTNKYE